MLRNQRKIKDTLADPLHDEIAEVENQVFYQIQFWRFRSHPDHS